MSNYNVEKDGYEKLPYAYPITEHSYNPDYQSNNENNNQNNSQVNYESNNQNIEKNQNTTEYLNDEEIARNLSREINEQPETRVVIIDRRTDDSLATSCCLGGALAMLCCTIQ